MAEAPVIGGRRQKGPGSQFRLPPRGSRSATSMIAAWRQTFRSAFSVRPHSCHSPVSKRHGGDTGESLAAWRLLTRDCHECRSSVFTVLLHVWWQQLGRKAAVSVPVALDRVCHRRPRPRSKNILYLSSTTCLHRRQTELPETPLCYRAEPSHRTSIGPHSRA